jgi:hypothetical protein
MESKLRIDANDLLRFVCYAVSGKFSVTKNLLQMYSACSEGLLVMLALRGNAADDGIAYPQGDSGQANDAL